MRYGRTGVRFTTERNEWYTETSPFPSRLLDHAVTTCRVRWLCFGLRGALLPHHEPVPPSSPAPPGRGFHLPFPPNLPPHLVPSLNSARLTKSSTHAMATSPPDQPT